MQEGSSEDTGKKRLKLYSSERLETDRMIFIMTGQCAGGANTLCRRRFYHIVWRELLYLVVIALSVLLLHLPWVFEQAVPVWETSF